jgi:hypothetical protein
MILSDLKEEYLFLDSNGYDFGITKIDKKNNPKEISGTRIT